MKNKSIEQLEKRLEILNKKLTCFFLKEKGTDKEHTKICKEMRKILDELQSRSKWLKKVKCEVV